MGGVTYSKHMLETCVIQVKFVGFFVLSVLSILDIRVIFFFSRNWMFNNLETITSRDLGYVYTNMPVYSVGSPQSYQAALSKSMG